MSKYKTQFKVMELDDRANNARPCCKCCRDCKGFQEIAQLNNAGLTIYRYTNRIKDDTVEDVFILHNTKDEEIRSDEIVHEFELNKITCPRCKNICEHAQRLMQNVTSIDKSNIIGICDHCKVKNDRLHKSCNVCEDIVSKFIISKDDQLEKSKQLVLIWLSNNKCSQNKTNNMNRHPNSSLFVEKLNKNSRISTRDPKITQIFCPTHQYQFDSTDSSFADTELSSYFRKDNVTNSLETNQHITTEEDKMWLDLMDHKNEAWKLNNLNKQLSDMKHVIQDPGIKMISNIKKYHSEGIIDRTVPGARNILKKDFSFCFPKEDKNGESSKVPIKKIKNILKTEVRETKRNEEQKINNEDVKKRNTVQKEIGKNLIAENKELLNKDDNEVGGKKQQQLIHKEKQDLEKSNHAENKKHVQKNDLSEDKKKLATKKADKLFLKEKSLSQEGVSKQNREKNILRTESQLNSSKTKEIKFEKDRTNKEKQDLEKHSLAENKKQVQKYDSSKEKSDKLSLKEKKGLSQEKEHKQNKEKNTLSTENQFESSKTKESVKVEKDSTRADKISSTRSTTNEATLDNRSNPLDRSPNPKQGLKKKEVHELALSTKYFREAVDQKVKEKESRLIKPTKTSEKYVHQDNKSDDLLKQLVQLKHSSVTDITSTLSDILTNAEQKNEQRKNSKTNENAEIIIGQSILKFKPPSKKVDHDDKPILFQSVYQEAISLEQNDTLETDPEEKLKSKYSSTKDAKSIVHEVVPKGIVRFTLSDRTFIDKGWTILPTEKVVRKMNVYRMRPAHPEFDWFENNKNKGQLQYDTGDKLAEFEESGRGRWFYRNGQLALDYYDAEEVNAQQRFVVYSSGEPDERGRSHPITILATFDYLGNGIVFDHGGKIRLKYNQTEGVVLDRGIGPVSHWKWHSLNDPPVLQKVMIDTQMPLKDPEILKFGEPPPCKSRLDNEEMLEIEFDNFIKEKSKKLSQTFKPFQIKMKALKINKHFSLRVLDQGNIYLIFRDGLTNLKLNIGMLLDHREIIDNDTAEVGEVSNNLERLPAHSESIAGLQRSISMAQRFERSRTERERRRVRPSEACRSADQLTAASSRPLRPVPFGSTTTAGDYCKCNRKPSSNLYYNTRLI